MKASARSRLFWSWTLVIALATATMVLISLVADLPVLISLGVTLVSLGAIIWVGLLLYATSQ